MNVQALATAVAKLERTLSNPRAFLGTCGAEIAYRDLLQSGKAHHVVIGHRSHFTMAGVSVRSNGSAYSDLQNWRSLAALTLQGASAHGSLSTEQ